MSNVSTAHDMRPFTAGDKPLTGQRLAKIGYKKTKDQPNPLPSVCVSLPHIAVSDIQDNISALMPYICNMLQDTQDKIIRQRYEDSQGSLKIVTDADVSVSACLAYLSAESEGNRLKSETIETWFDAALSDNLTAYIAEKLGFQDFTDAQQATVAKHVKVYREVMASLAGGKTLLAEKQIKGCRTALALAADDSDPMVGRLSKRLDSMEKKATDEFLDL